jgi:DNA-binding transcriptional regulator PaaX
MGDIEQKIKVDIRRSKINSAVIATLAVGGALALGAVAPNVLGVLGKLGISTPQKKQNVGRSLTRLIRYGYIKIEEAALGKRLRLTLKGEKYALRLGTGRLVPKKPRRWDKKWRLLIFDIPERRKRVREQIRKTLIDVGFYRLQDSVWVYPYDCEDLITLLKAELRIGKDVLYIVADAIEYDLPLRKKFALDK